MQQGHALRDSLWDSVVDFLYGALQRLLESEGVGRAMALDHDAFQTEEAGAIIAPVVHPPAKRVYDRQRDEGGEA